MSVAQPPDRPTAGAEHAAPARTLSYVLAGVLLVSPFVALLWVSSYAKDSPRLFGFPFFYWYQLLWVFLASAMTYGALLIVRHVERPRPRLTDRSERSGATR